MATLASSLDFDLPDDAAEDSHNLLPLIKGEVDKVRKSHVHNTKESSFAIRKGEWILISGKTGYVSGRNKDWEEKRNYPADNKADVELYHFTADPGQKNDVAADHPEKVTEMKALLSQIREQGYSAPRLAK